MMNAVDRAVINLWIGMKFLVNEFLFDEEGDVNVVSIIVLIGVAIILAVVFRDRAKELISTLMGNVDTQATNAIEGN